MAAFRLMKPIKLIFAALAILSLLAGCGDDDRETIKWQLPLTAPDDPHGGQIDQSMLPEWASVAEGSVSLMFLQVSTARSFSVDVANHEKKMFHDWDVTLLGLAKGLRTRAGTFIDDENVHNPAAFVELVLQR